MTTTKTPSNTSQRFPKPLLKSTKMPSPSLRSTLASASSVMTLASQANGSGGSSRDAAGRRQGDGRWNRSRGQGKRENRLEVEQSGEPLLDTVAVEDVMERATWEEDGLKESLPGLDQYYHYWGWISTTTTGAGSVLPLLGLDQYYYYYYR